MKHGAIPASGFVAGARAAARGTSNAFVRPAWVNVDVIMLSPYDLLSYANCMFMFLNMIVSSLPLAQPFVFANCPPQ
jgi:hypothetical protein